MLTKTYRKGRTDVGGYACKCCDLDGRKHKAVRRTARRIEKQTWKREAAY